MTNKYLPRRFEPPMRPKNLEESPYPQIRKMRSYLFLWEDDVSHLIDYFNAKIPLWARNEGPLPSMADLVTLQMLCSEHSIVEELRGEFSDKYYPFWACLEKYKTGIRSGDEARNYEALAEAIDVGGAVGKQKGKNRAE